MKLMKNENGYALLMVMMLVLLFTTLGMGLLAMNINASKQFNMKEEQVQARHQAEMGLLHYQATLKEEVINYSFVKNSGESNENALKRSRVEMCNKLKVIKVQSDASSTVKYDVKVPVMSGCESLSTSEKIVITVNSVGTSNQSTEKIVKGTLTLEPPKVTDSTGVPTKPESPPGVPVIGNKEDLEKELEEDTEIHKHVVIDGPFVTRKEQHFFESFVINTKTTSEDALTVGPGSKDVIEVEKDFYVGGKIDAKNHVCIYVRGNLTVMGETILNNKSVIVVYGNAHFKTTPDDKHSNAGIFVVGDTYINNIKKPANDYKKFNVANSDCSMPQNWEDPKNVVPGTTRYYWETIEELNPEYL